jgi:hypothetical protein
MAERWYARLSKFFHHELRGRQPLILYASPTDFQQTNVIPGDLGEGTGGVTEPVRRRIVLPDRLATRTTSWDTNSCTRFSSTSPRRSVLRQGSTVRSVCRSGSLKEWRSTSHSVQSIPIQRCGCATPRGRNDCPPSRTSITLSTFLIAGDRHSGRTSVARTETT